MFTENYIKVQTYAMTVPKAQNETVYSFDGVNYMALDSSTTAYTLSNIGLVGAMLYGGLLKARASSAPSTSTTAGRWATHGVQFGQGNTPPTKADLALENPIEEGMEVTNPTAIVKENDENGRYSVSATYSLKNTSETEINICEIGIFLPIKVSSYYFPSLMERTVLSEPITIPPGEMKVVTYKLTFNHT